MTIQHVAIVGGTHGNEITGLHLVQHWQESPDEVLRNSFATELHIANPQANRIMKRYVDQDLNRQFALEDLNNTALTNYEQSRAKAINHMLGPKEDPRVDFVIDLHTTTANMGLTLVISENSPFLIGMAFYIKSHMPETVLFYEPKERLDDYFLASLGRHNGLLIEVGPTPQGLLRADVYDLTRRATLHALDYIEHTNRGDVLDLPDSYEAFEFVDTIKLPESTDGRRWGMVHPSVQDQDYQPINPGDPLFLTFSGEVIPYSGNATHYLAFVNEAAYYDRNIGVSLMNKITLQRP
ncbi:aspartoacylase [Salinispirillum marinum]|uniref:Aspartoacylase n=2 Tax=Saccharospirillaceae TaxID=255527 RepID=A0ABV8BEV2_9GAMM